MENPLSSTRTLSSMKNLDNFTFGDQFFNDKSQEDESGKPNMETEVESMVTVPIHQALSSIPPLSTPIIDADLAARVSALEKKYADFEQKNKTLDNTTQNLGSRIIKLELCDLPHKINQTVNEVVKKAIQTTLQAPLRDHFRDLLEADMKEILHQWMFESGSYRSQPKHASLYEALERSMDCENKDEFIETLAQTSSTWKTSNTREAHYSSSKQKSTSQFKQLVEDIPIADDVHVSGSEDIGDAHLLKIKTRPDWLKPIPEEERPETPEPDWVIPTNDLLEPENN
ncbi:hypothetical protein Tco_0610302 [Tanacetum coccineum]